MTHEQLPQIEQIRQMKIAYGRALDTRNWASFAGLLAEEVYADFSSWGVPARRMEKGEVVALFRNAEMKSQQVYSNFTIAVTGDEAAMTSSLTGHHQLPSLPQAREFTLHATYHDRLVRTGEGWKFTELKLEVVFVTGNPAVLG